MSNANLMLVAAILLGHVLAYGVISYFIVVFKFSSRSRLKRARRDAFRCGWEIRQRSILAPDYRDPPSDHDIDQLLLEGSETRRRS